MNLPSNLRRRPAGLLVSALVLLAAAVGVSACADAASSAAPSTAIRVSTTPAGPAIPSGFLGLSMEYRGLETYAGTSARSLDAPFAALMRDLAPYGNPVLRIGGDSTDWTWWPVAHVARPGGVRFSLDSTWAAVARALTAATGARLILGINFEADSRTVAAGMANALLANLGRSAIAAFELGNEPELYSGFSWYKTPSGHKVYGRPKSYTPQTYLGDFAQIASALPRVPLAGPSSGSTKWLASLSSFAAHEPRVNLVTVHAYPLKHCTPKEISTYGDLFAGSSLQGLANQIHGWVVAAGRHHRPVRVDEMNSVSCGGQNGFSQSFGPALWALDVLPRIVRAGAAGVNFDTVPNTWQALINAAQSHGRWRVVVEPEFYGLMAFAQAAPPGARMLNVSGSTPGLDVWATRARNGAIHVVLVNLSGRAASTKLQIAGATAQATLTRLQAPSLSSTSQVTLGGQSLSPATGTLAGTPAAQTLKPAGGGYAVRVPGHSAATLYIPGAPY